MHQKPGDIMLVGNGGSVLFYVVGHDTTVTRRLVELLQQSDFAGVIFTKQRWQERSIGGRKNRNRHAPDVVMSFRWYDSKNQFGIPGMIDADWQRAAGKGTHATSAGSTCTTRWSLPARTLNQTKRMICPQAIPILPQRSSAFCESRPRRNWMDAYFRKRSLIAPKGRPQGTAVSRPPHRPFRENRKRKQLKLEKIFHLARGGNRFKSRAWVRPYILMKATARSWQIRERPRNHTVSALRIASTGASRLNQIENESAP